MFFFLKQLILMEFFLRCGHGIFLFHKLRCIYGRCRSLCFVSPFPALAGTELFILLELLQFAEKQQIVYQVQQFFCVVFPAKENIFFWKTCSYNHV